MVRARRLSYPSQFPMPNAQCPMPNSYMFNYVTLRKTGDRWEFDSEAALEDFLWDKLEPLFALKPLKRQYNANEQFCDILGTSDRQQLAILELKNSEDRYVVQQLTRYYDVLVEQKSFAEVDYEQPIRLAAIAPSFHRDNFTDLKYHLLASQFEFWQFSIVEEGEKFYFDLKNLQREATCRAEIPYRLEAATPDVPDPPRKLLKMIADCPEDKRQIILGVRHKILSFDSRIQEKSDKKSVKYGRSQNELCAEISSHNAGEAMLFLWLPKPSSRQKVLFCRMLMKCKNNDWKNVELIYHCPSGFKGARRTRENYWEISRLIKWYRESPDYQTVFEKEYGKLMQDKDPDKFLDTLLDMALEKWLARLK
ncbi:MAG: DUF91 domain-containing protein [Oscillatoria sp. SIO1A7]|nr:DUF91 domain-containing protein [Oscillatoria sp. SIO1A7]